MAVRLFRDVLIPDLYRMARHGLFAPRWSERIWIDPMECTRAVAVFPRNATGHVVGGDWDLRTSGIDSIPKIRMARLHWQDGVPWADTGAYDYMMARIGERGRLDGCRTLDDVVRRYEALDRIFAVVSREGRMLSRAELPGRSLREKGGIFVHIGRDNQPIFGIGGCHRLAMAQILGLSRIPAQLGVLHPLSLSTWRSLRIPPSSGSARRTR